MSTPDDSTGPYALVLDVPGPGTVVVTVLGRDGGEVRPDQATPVVGTMKVALGMLDLGVVVRVALTLQGPSGASARGLVALVRGESVVDMRGVEATYSASGTALTVITLVVNDIQGTPLLLSISDDSEDGTTDELADCPRPDALPGASPDSGLKDTGLEDVRTGMVGSFPVGGASGGMWQPPAPGAADSGDQTPSSAVLGSLPSETRDGAEQSAHVGAEYRVWYGTNRQPVDRARPTLGYSAERDEQLHYGSCRVFVPRSHKIGSTGSPWWRRDLARTDDRLRVIAVETTDDVGHWRAIRDHVAHLAPDDRDAVVFLHGYNVSFAEAALRAAQIGYDLQVKTMAFFSWPSRGTLHGYAADAASIEASEHAIAEYLADIAARSGARRVHVIAHSMGNRGLLRAVNRIVSAAEGRTPTRFGQFILAAADVDVDTFRDLSRAYRRVCERATLYVSARDRAVAFSEMLYGAPRIGYTPPVTVIDEVDTVAVSNVDLTLLGHGYVAEAREVLHDMDELLRYTAPPGKRVWLKPGTTELGETYWEVRA